MPKLQVLPEINVCDFSTLDLDKDYDVDEEELITLIQMSGLEELEDLFEKLDKDGGKYLFLFFFHIHSDKDRKSATFLKCLSTFEDLKNFQTQCSSIIFELGKIFSFHLEISYIVVYNFMVRCSINEKKY